MCAHVCGVYHKSYSLKTERLDGSQILSRPVAFFCQFSLFYAFTFRLYIGFEMWTCKIYRLCMLDTSTRCGTKSLLRHCSLDITNKYILLIRINWNNIHLSVIAVKAVNREVPCSISSGHMGQVFFHGQGLGDPGMSSSVYVRQS